MRIYLQHLMEIKYCRRGARRFCRRHGLDWSSFVAHGIPAEKLLCTGDHMAIELVKVAANADKP